MKDTDSLIAGLNGSNMANIIGYILTSFYVWGKGNGSKKPGRRNMNKMNLDTKTTGANGAI